jgi:hypothetical protein
MNHRNLILLIAISATLAGCVNADDTPKSASESSAHSDDSSGNSDSQTVNGSIRVKPGEKRDDVSTVNGSIHIDDNASVAGAHTVNGSISLGEHSSAASLHSVNGSITIGAGATVSDNVSAVNGSLTLRDGADVHSSLDNVNGRIQLQAAHVGGGIKTVSGDIDIGSGSHVEGGILVHKASEGVFGLFHWGKNDMPRIVIGPGAVVEGNLQFEREVELFVSDSATIGAVSGANPVKFSGAKPSE